MNLPFSIIGSNQFLRVIALTGCLALNGCGGDKAVDTSAADSVNEAGSTNSIWIEAESVDRVVPPWTVETSKVGYSGNGYLFNTSDVELARSGGEIVYEFEVEEAGEYMAVIRGRRDDEGHCEDQEYDKCNDVRSAWNGGTFEKTMVKGPWGCWIWETRIELIADGVHSFKRNTAPLKPGRNTFHVGVRSSGVKLDAILIHRVGDPLPSGLFTAPACAETISLTDAVELHGKPLPAP